MQNAKQQRVIGYARLGGITANNEKRVLGREESDTHEKQTTSNRNSNLV